MEVESVLNSRPLTCVSAEDMEEALTPSHLLTGHRVLSLPDPATDEDDPDYSPTPDSLTRRMRHLGEVTSRFWKRWKTEYLQELREQHRTGAATGGENRPIQQDEPVIVYDEAQPRGLWRLGRVTRLLRGGDGEVRAAEVKVHSKTGTPTVLRRPIQHLYPLEVRDTTSNSEDSIQECRDQSIPEESTPHNQRDRDPREPDRKEEQDSPPRRRYDRRAAQRARDSIQRMAAQNCI